MLNQGSIRFTDELGSQSPPGGKGPGSSNLSDNAVDDSPEESPSDDVDPDEVVDTASVHSDESYTMRERQDAINSAHPFGIRLWKPALYKKKRSVERNADEDIHSLPNLNVPRSVLLGNILWTVTIGLLLSLVFFIVWLPLIFMAPFSDYARRYAALLRQVALFFWVPFGKYVQLIYSENYREEDDGHGRPVADYLAWQQSMEGGEQRSRLFFAPRRRRPSQYARPEDVDPNTSSSSPNLTEETHQHQVRQFRLFGRGSWSAARVVFYLGYYLVLVPIGALVAVTLWLSVFGVPMARVIYHMLYHMRIHPLALSVQPTNTQHDVESCDSERTSIVLCTYRAFGLKYYKYTVDGTNIMLINMMFVVFLTICDKWVFGMLSDTALFILSLISIIPLAHFIGQAVASISAQSSMSMGATINAFFSTIVEVYLYLVALSQGKGELVEGSITGSVLAGVLLMPGLSMCAGALNKKTQRFNPKSAGATSTMLLYTVVGVIAPTIFYSLYGPQEIQCKANKETGERMCWNMPIPLKADDPTYIQIMKPFGYFCAIVLFIAYAIGLMFTLRTHAAMIWTTGANDEQEEHAHEDGPNWHRRKSYIILLSATVLYAMIAEILVDSVDMVLAHINISQRMLGITVFALVPNSTEFLNAISFALYGNVSLSLEIGSAYALQVCLLQIPALVLFSQRHISSHVGEALRKYVFVLLFPKWDTWAWIVSMLLFCHVHSEGRSNYFKGSILILAYLVLVAGFHFNDVISKLMPAQQTLPQPMLLKQPFV